MTIAPATTASIGSPSRIRLGDLHVVMADDDRNDHLLVLMAADAAGLQANFTFVDSGAKLMYHLAGIETTNDLPDLILLDLRMDGLDGHRTLEELQAHPVLWQVPVVIFSSSTRTRDVRKSYEGGARHYETKPSDFDELVSFMRRLPHFAECEDYTEADAGPLANDACLAALAHDVIADLEDEFVTGGSIDLLPNDGMASG